MFLTIKLYLCSTELFEIKLFICIKMDLVLKSLQRLVCHKTQNKESNQPRTMANTKYGILTRNATFHYTAIYREPHETGKCGTRPFFEGGSGSRNVTHTRPAFPKIPQALSAFLLHTHDTDM